MVKIFPTQKGADITDLAKALVSYDLKKCFNGDDSLKVQSVIVLGRLPCGLCTAYQDGEMLLYRLMFSHDNSTFSSNGAVCSYRYGCPLPFLFNERECVSWDGAGKGDPKDQEEIRKFVDEAMNVLKSNATGKVERKIYDLRRSLGGYTLE